MDTSVAGWVLDFVLRQPILSDTTIVSLLTTILPFANLNDDDRFVKTLLLRRISSQIINHSVSIKTLDTLELIEQFDYEHNIDILDSMKEAYWAVALHCTVMCLKEDSGNLCDYFDAVVKIWRERIEVMENYEVMEEEEDDEEEEEEEEGGVGLVSDRLKEMRLLIKETVWDADVRNNVSKRDTLGIAVKALKVFVADAMEKIGSSVIEVAAKVVSGGDNSKEKDVEVVSKNLVDEQSEVREECSFDAKVVSGDNKEKEVEVVSKNLVDEQSESFDAHREMDLGSIDRAADSCVVTEKIGPSILEVAAKVVSGDIKEKEVEVTSKNLVDDQSEVGEACWFDAHCEMDMGSSDRAADSCVVTDKIGPSIQEVAAKEKEVQVISKNLVDEQSEVREACLFDGHREMDMGNSERAVDSCREVPRATTRTSKVIGTPEFKKVQEELRASTSELRKVVTDPLPEALCFAATVSASMSANQNVGNVVDKGKGVNVVVDKGKGVNVVEDKGKGVNVVVDKGKGVNVVDKGKGVYVEDKGKGVNVVVDKGKGVYVPSDDEDDEAVDKNEVNIGKQRWFSRPSFMARNSTARTYEWDEDSIESSDEEEGSPSRPRPRPHLPTPRKRAVSPLETEDTWGIARRKTRKWSDLEEQALRDGVKEFGKGNWKAILDKYSEILAERTSIDLKDKWRNMAK